jgi:hypothetical protein
MPPIRRGAVIEYPALFDFDSYPRPYLIVSGQSHPFHGEEYIGIAITTTALESAIPISDDAWIRGGLPKESFLKPWQPTLLKHADISDAFGVLRQTVVDRTAEELASVIRN